MDRSRAQCIEFRGLGLKPPLNQRELSFGDLTESKSLSESSKMFFKALMACSTMLRNGLYGGSFLRANVGIYRESQISSEKSNFGLYHPNNPLVWLFQKMILKNPQALCIWIILEKFENSQKNTIFIHELVTISNDFKETVRAQKISC